MSDSEILIQLSRPFHPSKISWKPGMVSKDQNKALALCYGDLRAYQSRLDEVCGMDWEVTYTAWGDKIVCHLTIAGVTRSSTGEGDKASEKAKNEGTSAESQAFKRACAMFGLGRYMYALPSVWVEYDPATKKFTDKAMAKLSGIIVQHYNRSVSEEQAKQDAEAEDQTVDPEEAEEAIRLLFNEAGQSLYGENWGTVKVRNVDKITGGKSETLTAIQMQKLIEGMKQLQSKRPATAVNGH